MTAFDKYSEILDSKTYVREGSPALSPRAYLTPVLEELTNYCSEDDIVIKSSHIIENANEDGTVNTAHGRVLVQAKLKEFNMLEADGTIGFVYALDKPVPEFVVYSGHEVFACTNLTIYADEAVNRIKDNHRAAQDLVKQHLVSMEKRTEEFIQFHNTLQGRDIDIMELDTVIGRLHREVITKYKGVGQTPIGYAHKEMLNNKSPYALRDGHTDMWNLYNAITDFYSGKFKSSQSLIERPLKTKELFNMFQTVLN